MRVRSKLAAGDGDIPVHLRSAVAAHAREWFPELGQRLNVRLSRSIRRSTCVLRVLQLDDGVLSRGVMTKERIWPARPRAGAAAGRPELTPVDNASPSLKAQLEFDGLRRAAAAVTRARSEDHFADASLGVVRPLLLLPQHATLVMDFVEYPSLRALVHRRINPLRLSSEPEKAPVRVAWRGTGSWLRWYQSSLGVPAPSALDTTPSLPDALSALGAYLCHCLAEPGIGRRLERVLDAVAGELTKPVPLAVTHGDLAPRNVLVSPTGRIFVIDPMPRRHAPAYEDLAKTVIAMRAGGAQLASGGAAIRSRVLDRWERDTMQGYFGAAAVPWPQVRLFQMAALLDVWAGHASATRPRSRALAALRNRHFHLEFERLATALESVNDSSQVRRGARS